MYVSIADNLKNSKLQDFVGPDGIRILSKAVRKVFAESDADTSIIFDHLQLKSRAMFTWLQKMAPTEIAESKYFKIPSTDYTLELIKADNDAFSGYIRKKEIATDVPLYALTGVSLPEVAGKILLLPEFESELNKSDNYKELGDLQNVVDFLVGNFLFGEQKKQILVLEKGESQSACPDCGGKIKVSEDGSRLCICYRIFGNSSLHVAKSEDGKMKITFGSQWDKKNVFLLAKALKNSLKR